MKKLIYGLTLFSLIFSVLGCKTTEVEPQIPNNTFIFNGKEYTLSTVEKYSSNFSCTKKDLYLYASNGSESLGFFIYNLPSYEGTFSFEKSSSCNLRSSGSAITNEIIDSGSDGKITISEAKNTFSLSKSNFLYRGTSKSVTVEARGTFK